MYDLKWFQWKNVQSDREEKKMLWLVRLNGWISVFENMLWYSLYFFFLLFLPPPFLHRCVFMRLTSIGVLLFSLWSQITKCKEETCICGYNHLLYSVSHFSCNPELYTIYFLWWRTGANINPTFSCVSICVPVAQSWSREESQKYFPPVLWWYIARVF